MAGPRGGYLRSGAGKLAGLVASALVLGLGLFATPPPGMSPAERTVAFLPGYETKAPENGGSFTRSLPADAVTLNPVIANDMVSYLVYKWLFDPEFRVLDLVVS